MICFIHSAFLEFLTSGQGHPGPDDLDQKVRGFHRSPSLASFFSFFIILFWLHSQTKSTRPELLLRCPSLRSCVFPGRKDDTDEHLWPCCEPRRQPIRLQRKCCAATNDHWCTFHGKSLCNTRSASARRANSEVRAELPLLLSNGSNEKQYNYTQTHTHTHTMWIFFRWKHLKPFVSVCYFNATNLRGFFVSSSFFK